MYDVLGFYVDCDDAYCVGCFEEVFGPDGEAWEGFESWDAPLPIFEDEESDTPTHCRRCETLLEHALTADGYAYVEEAFERARDHKDGRRCIVRAWVEAYSEDEEALETVAAWPSEDAYSPTA